jgi:NAD(P)-dependent dehydrogenase (short-subunit alcohol dehydrogenase family)
MKLKDKVTVVTGIGSGMGKAIAIVYAEQGAKGVVSDINEASANATEKKLSQPVERLLQF